MAERTETTSKLLHGADRRLVTPLETLRGADFAVGAIISGAVASNDLPPLSGGGRLRAVITSSVVRIRPISLEMHNGEPGWLEVEFRDGGTNGARVLGPYRLDPRAERAIPVEQLQGRYFTSSVHAQILSGYTAQPLSNGVKINVGFILDPQDLYE